MINQSLFQGMQPRINYNYIQDVNIHELKNQPFVRGVLEQAVQRTCKDDESLQAEFITGVTSMSFKRVYHDPASQQAYYYKVIGMY